MKICVFCASSESVDDVYFEAAADLGKEIVMQGWELLYGGTNCGLMREVSDAVKNSGGKVTGIIPQCIVDRGVSAEGISELIVTSDMKERKSMMREKADAFIALPGGWGTLEEITEGMSKVSLKHLDAPCILYNLNGYYDGLKVLLGHMIEMGLSSKDRQEGVYFADTLDEIERILAEK